MKDLLNRNINVGDTVLTKSYYSPTTDFLTTVLKVNKKSVRVQAPANAARYSYKERQTVPRETLSRKSNEVIVVNEQLAYNKANFPENFV